MTQRKAVALISGGLDSLLAAKVMLEQGIHVEGINFFTGFCVEGHTHAIRDKDKKKKKRNNALWVAEQLGIKLHIIDIVEEYKDIVLNPKHGYGANLNPCLDCKIFMVKSAMKWMEENQFDFIITGEVIGQRPMSQRRATMPIVSDDSGADDLLLRPLCAKRLPMTKPEIEHWVDREKLYEFSGRSRKPQFALAKEFGFEDYAQPAGGCCFLTDANYSEKLQDLWKNRGEKKYELDDIMLLKVGRHIRPNEKYKLIIAREEGEGRFLSGYRYMFPAMESLDFMGPLALIDGELSDIDLEIAAKIVARYGQGKNEKSVKVKLMRHKQDDLVIEVEPYTNETLPKEWIL